MAAGAILSSQCGDEISRGLFLRRRFVLLCACVRITFPHAVRLARRPRCAPRLRTLAEHSGPPLTLRAAPQRARRSSIDSDLTPIVLGHCGTESSAAHTSDPKMRRARAIAAAIFVACTATLHTDAASAAAAAHATPQPPSPQSDPMAAFSTLPWGWSASNISLAVTSGSVPVWLRGSLYRNGPALYPNISDPHWFDGLALLQAFHFNDGEVTYDAAFVGSLEYNFSQPLTSSEQVQKQRRSTDEDADDAANPFSLASLSALASNLSAAVADASSDDDSSVVRNWAPHISVNTVVTVQELNGHLLASTATTSSNEFAPVSVTNVATPFVFDDQDAVGFQMGAEHRRRGPDGSLYHFAYSASWTEAGQGNYTLYRMRPDPSGEGRSVREVFSQLPYRFGQNYQHSFSVTAHYMVLSEVPVPLPESVAWSAFVLTPNVSTYFRVVDLQSGEEVATFASQEGFFMFHHINAYEHLDASTGTLSIVLDLIAYPDCTLIPLLSLANIRANYSEIMALWSEARTMRFILPLTGNTPDRILTVPALDLNLPPIELPSTSPAVEGLDYRFAFAMGSSGPRAQYYDTIVKIDMSLEFDTEEKKREQQQVQPGRRSGLKSRVLQSWQSPGCMTAESVFVASPSSSAEDDGVLLSLVLDSINLRSFVLILDAASFDEVARVQLPQAMPAGFHGIFSTMGVESEFRKAEPETKVAVE